PYIFDAFYRGTHSRKEAGHGFGLTIVKSVVDLHGWSIEARNRKTSTQSQAENKMQEGSKGQGLVIEITMKPAIHD
ncbi:MAG: ATP-binding protein, partial [Rectinema sp.]